MNFIENFLHILKESKQIIGTCEEKDNITIPDYKIAKEIYLDAFRGLTMNGYPYQIEEGVMVIEICGDKYWSETTIPSILETSAVKNSYETKLADKSVFIRHHECAKEEDEEITDIEDITPSTEKRTTKGDQDAHNIKIEEELNDIAEHKQKEEITDTIDSNTMEEPEFDKFEESTGESDTCDLSPAEKITPVQEETSATQEKELSVQMKHIDMPDHMQKDDFTFNFDKIRISNADGSIKKDARLLVMPMSISVDNPEILVCAIINKESHVVTSQNGIANIKVAEYSVEISGQMDGGIFTTQYKLDQYILETGVIIQTKSKHHGLKGHIVLDDEGVVVHILPAGFTNNEDGFASFIYYINVNGEETMGDTSSGKPITFMYQEKELCLQAKWKDDVMYCYVSEYREDSKEY